MLQQWLHFLTLCTEVLNRGPGSYHENGQLDRVSGRRGVACLQSALAGHIALRAIASRCRRAVYLQLAATEHMVIVSAR